MIICNKLYKNPSTDIEVIAVYMKAEGRKAKMCKTATFVIFRFDLDTMGLGSAHC